MGRVRLGRAPLGVAPGARPLARPTTGGRGGVLGDGRGSLPVVESPKGRIGVVLANALVTETVRTMVVARIRLVSRALNVRPRTGGPPVPFPDGAGREAATRRRTPTPGAGPGAGVRPLTPARVAVVAGARLGTLLPRRPRTVTLPVVTRPPVGTRARPGSETGGAPVGQAACVVEPTRVPEVLGGGRASGLP